MIAIKNHKKNIITVLFICSLTQMLNSGSANAPQAVAQSPSQHMLSNVLTDRKVLLLCAVPTVMLGISNFLQIQALKQDLAKKNAVKDSAVLSPNESLGSRLEILENKIEEYLKQSDGTTQSLEKDVADARIALRKFNEQLGELAEANSNLGLRISNTDTTLNSLGSRMQNLENSTLKRSSFELIEKKEDGKYLALKK